MKYLLQRGLIFDSLSDALPRGNAAMRPTNPVSPEANLRFDMRAHSAPTLGAGASLCGAWRAEARPTGRGGGGLETHPTEGGGGRVFV